MDSHLKKIDMFGVSFSFSTFGKAKFTTSFGGFLTLVTLCIVTIFIYIFGTDFFHKENPNVVESDLVHLQTKPIAVPNEKISFMFRLQDGSTVPYDIDSIPFKVTVAYFHFRKNSQGKDELYCFVRGSELVSKCSKTKASLNPDLGGVVLEDWLCWDMEKIKEECKKVLGDKDPDYEPFLGGHFDENDYSSLRFDVVNYDYDGINKKYLNVYPLEELNKYNGNMMLSLRFPNFSYDSSRVYDPLQVYYDTQLIALNSGTRRRENRFNQLVTAIDDHGWMFKSTVTKTILAPDKTDVEYTPNDSSGRMTFFTGFIWNVKKEKVLKRNFMKVQQLVAIVGGMIKSVVGIFSVITLYRALFERDQELIRQFYKLKLKLSVSNNSELPLNNKETKVNTVMEPRKLTEIEDDSLSFWAYLFRFCCKSSDKARAIEMFDKMRDYMNEKMDVSYLFKLFEQFTMIKNFLLTDDQKELLENAKTEIDL